MADQGRASRFFLDIHKKNDWYFYPPKLERTYV